MCLQLLGQRYMPGHRLFQPDPKTARWPVLPDQVTSDHQENLRMPHVSTGLFSEKPGHTNEALSWSILCGLDAVAQLMKTD